MKNTALKQSKNTQSSSIIHELIKYQVMTSPHAIAGEFANESMTYSELENRASKLAVYLRKEGIGQNDLVGICLNRSLDVLVALYGILKAGAAYVPLDPANPQDRLSLMIEDSGMKYMVSHPDVINNIPKNKVSLIYLNEIKESSNVQNFAKNNPSDLAYVIYTSGSTGKPKGVEIPHQAVTNFLQSMSVEPGISSHDTVLAVTTPSFDIAVLELILPLSVGAKVVIAPREVVPDGKKLLNLLETCKATLMQATPITWRLMIEAGWKKSPNLKILCGGEPLDRPLAHQLLERGTSVWNMYGPTETTVWSTLHKVSKNDDPIPIGHAIANTPIYILDEADKEVANGEIGELCIGGIGLARGYHNRPDLTSQKFVVYEKIENAKIYKTGDLAKYNKNGELECLGRIDNQIKIRGYRVELGEIEMQIVDIGKYPQAVVHPKVDPTGNKKLVAYVKSDTKGKPFDHLRNELKAKLPDYMIPTLFMIVEKFPLTHNGKVDRKSLPEPSWEHTEAAPESVPTTFANPTEEQLSKLWCEVLKVPSIQRTDDFLAMGGDSIKIATLSFMIEDTFNVEVPLTIIFQKSGFIDLATIIAEKIQTG